MGFQLLLCAFYDFPIPAIWHNADLCGQSACIGPLSWAYPAEIFSTRTRAKSTAITSASSWISNL
jgi:hypothetical protein